MSATCVWCLECRLTTRLIVGLSVRYILIVEYYYTTANTSPTERETAPSKMTQFTTLSHVKMDVSRCIGWWHREWYTLWSEPLL